MINFFNKLANSWIAKIICAVLAVSMMAFWGLGGISMTAGQDNVAAKVGRQKISMNKINQSFEAQRNKLAQMTGTFVSHKQAIESGLLDQVVQQAVADNLQNQIQDKIGLIASDKSVRKYVENNPVFQDSLGHFDSNLFYAYLGQLKMNQEQLAEKLKQELAAKHLQDALLKSTPREKKLMKLAAQAQKEKRQISYYLLKQSEIPVVIPSNEELKEFYEAYQENFTTPEYRKIHLLSIMPGAFKGDKEAAYDKMYKSVQDLEDLLGSGTSLKEASKKLGLSEPVALNVDISGKTAWGQLADNRLKDNTLLQEAFVLSTGEATSIIDYENGFLVAEVLDITPTAFSPFETVKDKVVALYKEEEQKEKLPKITEEIEQALIQGKGWKKYQPQTKIITRNQGEAAFKDSVAKIFAQDQGNKNVQSLPVAGGNLIVVVDKVISDTTQPTEKEQSEAVRSWTKDLQTALQQSFVQDLDVKVNTEAIKKTFSTYTKEEN